IPVLAAAHYHMGGIATDAWGRTSLAGLMAVGECASTGVHGANRLASNSLVEAAVWGARAGEAARESTSLPGAILSAAPAPGLPPATLAGLRARMSADAAVVRDAAGLGGLAAWIAGMEARCGPALPLVAARLVVDAAMSRRESRGAHFRADHPAPAAAAVHTRLTLDREPARERAA
ncbi:MAG: FAD-binding protein, partial [Caulobacteraceae bacterium]